MATKSKGKKAESILIKSSAGQQRWRSLRKKKHFMNFYLLVVNWEGMSELMLILAYEVYSLRYLDRV